MGVNRYNQFERLQMAQQSAAEAHNAIKELRRRFDILVPARDGRDGAKGEKGDSIVGPAGKDSTVAGPQGERGPKGERGDVTIVGDAELLAAVNVLKAKQAKFLAALQIQVERNAGRKHRGLQQAIDNVLQTLKQDAGL